MTADEMFEELGYKNGEMLNETLLSYYNKTNSMEITFDLSEKTFIKYDKFWGAFLRINMEELKAINLKCKELGWIE